MNPPLTRVWNLLKNAALLLALGFLFLHGFLLCFCFGITEVLSHVITPFFFDTLLRLVLSEATGIAANNFLVGMGVEPAAATRGEAALLCLGLFLASLLAGALLAVVWR